MAKGILMHRERITDDQAFTLLLSTAKANIKIHDLAAWFVDDAKPTPTRLTRAFDVSAASPVPERRLAASCGGCIVA